MRITPLRLGFVKAFLIQDQGAVLIDSGAPAGRRPHPILAALAAAGVAPADLSLILLTHGHDDHAGGCAALKHLAPSLPVAAGRGDLVKLRTASNDPIRPRTLFGRLLMALPLPMPSMTPFEPELLVDGELDLAPYGVAGRAISTPGHTPGSLTVIAGTDACVGDLLMAGPVAGKLSSSRPSWPFLAEEPGLLRKSLELVLAAGVTTLHPAHGGPFKAEVVKAWLETQRS
jgi:glyoxylase-like metal-dependent hydrolase (beta-lactamase superfamily II)